MRVLLASLHPRAFSGQIHSLKALGRALDGAGDDVRLETATLPGPAQVGRLPSIARSAVSMARVIGAIARAADDADVVHLYLPTPGFTILADWLAARIRTPLIVGYEAPLVPGDLVGSLLRDARLEPGFYLPRLLVNSQLVGRLGRYGAAAYVVSSRYQQAQLDALGAKGRVAVIPNVVDFESAGDGRGGHEPASADAESGLARRKLGLPEAVPLVGYVGHFHPVKGVETLVRAFAQLRARVPDARLVLAWSGLGDRAGVASLLARLGCSDGAIWLGRTSLPDLLRALDVLALPYRYPIGQNAFPNVLLEAQGIGVPVVTTEIPIVAEACQAQETALLVPPGEPGHLATAIEHLFGHPALRAAMVSRQRLWYAERFAPEALAGRYHSLYRGVLGRGVLHATEQGGAIRVTVPEVVRLR